MSLRPASRSRLSLASVGCLLAVFAAFAHAEPITRYATVTIIHPMAVQRTHCPTCSGITRIYVTPEAWGTSDCRSDAGDLFLEDKHILATLMWAKSSGLPVRLEVESTVRPLDTVCKITAAYVG